MRFSRPVAGGSAGVLNKQLVFAALLNDEDGHHLRCEPRVLAPNAQGWDERPPLKEADGQKTLLLPKGSAVGGFGDKLALLRPAEPDAQVGLWSPADGHAVLPFKPVPFRRGPAGASERRVQEMAYLLAVIGIVLLVYWRRRESISSPVVLPPGTAAADFGRRGLGALIDMAPAAIVVGLIWQAPLTEYLSEWETAINAQDTVPPESHGLGWAWACFALLYSGWCMAFELFLSASPGKRLLGCRVVSESMERPTRVQIVVRNASRLIELLPYLQVWPFVLVVLMTRNRQRVGDLLARTIVVERAAAVEDAEADELRRRRDTEKDDEA